MRSSGSTKPRSSGRLFVAGVSRVLIKVPDNLSTIACGVPLRVKFNKDYESLHPLSAFML